MSEMVERVARALEPKFRGFGHGDMPMALAREFARCAIEAMRIPTEPMVDAMHDLASANGVHFATFEDSGELFKIAIDVALGLPTP